MSMEFSLLLLLVCGAAMGYFGGRMFRSRFGGNQTLDNTGKKLSASQRKQLRQLESQRDSGLLTKKEFAAKKKELLKNR